MNKTKKWYGREDREAMLARYDAMNGVGVAAAAKQFGICEQTLRNWLRDRSPSRADDGPVLAQARNGFHPVTMTAKDILPADPPDPAEDRDDELARLRHELTQAKIILGDLMIRYPNLITYRK